MSIKRYTNKASEEPRKGRDRHIKKVFTQRLFECREFPCWPFHGRSAEDVESEGEMGGGGLEVVGTGKDELEEIAGLEAEVIVALMDTLAPCAGPRSRATFEANHGHVGRDTPGNPATKLRRNGGGRENSRRKRKVACQGRRGVGGTFSNWIGHADASKQLSMEEVKGLR